MIPLVVILSGAKDLAWRGVTDPLPRFLTSLGMTGGSPFDRLRMSGRTAPC